MFRILMKKAISQTKKHYPAMAKRGWLWVCVIHRGLARPKYQEIREWVRACSFKFSSVRIYWSMESIYESDGVGHPAPNYAPVFIRVRDAEILRKLKEPGTGKKAFRR